MPRAERPRLKSLFVESIVDLCRRVQDVKLLLKAFFEQLALVESTTFRPGFVDQVLIDKPV